MIAEMQRLLLVIAACGHPATPVTMQTDIEPPIAAKHSHVVSSPNGSREDPYYWLRDDTHTDPDVRAYIDRENAYTDRVVAPLAPLERALFDELRSHVSEDDSSPPIFDRGYYVYSRYAPDQDQPIIARKAGSLDAPEQVVLDGNKLARGQSFYTIGAYAISNDGRYVAWVDDVVGRRQYRLHVKDLTTGATLPETAENVADSLVWARDNRTLFYVGKDSQTLREDRIYAHRLGEREDREVFREPDGSYYVSLAPTKSQRYIRIILDARTNSEVRLIDADHPDAPPRVFLPRAKDIFYEVDHIDDRFIIRTNEGTDNFRVVDVPDGSERDHTRWHPLVAAKDREFIESFVAYRRFIAVAMRVDGYLRVLVIPRGKPSFLIATPEAVGTTDLIDTPDPDAAKLRYSYTSLVTPASIYELAVDTGAQTILQQTVVPNYDPSRYATTSVRAVAGDGAEIPISLVYRRNTKLDGTAPLEVFGFGAAGLSMNPQFQIGRLPLLDRGWVFAIAHIRGGHELGQSWYENGNLMKKRNTFTDFIAATEYLVAHGYGAHDQVFAYGASAGGLLMGAIANMRPDLYRGIIAVVPFVDIVTTMLDETLPLTTNEYDLWGNPNEKAAYDYMLSYSPYDNVAAQSYPSMYVRASFWDSQVQYFEPTKWVAKLRATKTNKNPLLLEVDMSGGHAGPVGRIDKLHESARDVAYLLTTRTLPDDRVPGRP